MRLTDKEAKAISEAVNRRFGPEAKVYLFGSRVDDQKRGGDIDVLVETDLSGQAAVRAKLDAMSDIQLILGDQKIDMVLTSPEERDRREIVRRAKSEGVLL
jgi:uncharacterized protein